MRSFEKIFVVSLPRCATVSMSQALGILGVPTSHLGKIYDQQSAAGSQHYDAGCMLQLFEQISRGEMRLALFDKCRAVADYPACCLDFLTQFRALYPNSLFINVRREHSIQRWLQSVEQQFIGLDLLNAQPGVSAEQRAFMQVMRHFRRLTFGSESFDAEQYLAAYENHQAELESLAAADDHQAWLHFDDPLQLEQTGFERLSGFLQVACPAQAFPRCDEHSQEPKAAFLSALDAGKIQSQTGIAMGAQQVTKES